MTSTKAILMGIALLSTASFSEKVEPAAPRSISLILPADTAKAKKGEAITLEAQAGIDESRQADFELRENAMVARRDSVVNFAKTFLGRPYVYGGTTPYGFDCSGFAWYIFRKFGYNMPRISSDQATLGRWVKTEEAEPGDLVFYGYPYGGGYVYTHTAIVYARDTKNNVSVIHSSFLGLAITMLHFDPSYTCRLIGIKRVIE